MPSVRRGEELAEAIPATLSAQRPGHTAPVSDDAQNRLESCLRMTEALLDAMEDAVRSSDPADVWRFVSYRAFMRKSNEIVEWVAAVEPLAAPVDRWDMDKVPTLGDTIAEQQQYYSKRPGPTCGS